MRQFTLNLGAFDSILHLFKPGVETGVVRTKPTPRRHAVIRHKSSRLVFTIPREFIKPMSTRATVQAIMKMRT